MPDLVLNELSFQILGTSDRVCAAQDAPTARSWMAALVETIRAAGAYGVQQTIRTDSAFLTIELAGGYSLPQWRNDSAVNRDLRIFFSRLATRAPYLDGALEELLNQAGRMEARFQGTIAGGLLAAFLLDGVAVSWPSGDTWRQTSLAFNLFSLSDDGEVVESIPHCRHASDPAHWDIHAEWIEQCYRSGIHDGAALWAMAPQLFPRLEFCGDAPGQLQSLTGNERYFQWVINCLFDADLECSRWTVGQFPHSALPGPASGESKPVHDNPDLRRHRMFRTPTGELLMFEHHMKNKAENKRIHYLVDESRRRIIIAYVGDKLPTGNYRT